MLKLTPTQAAKVAKLAQDYSEFILARSNADDWMMTFHGGWVLEAAGELGCLKLFGNLEFEVAQAQKRLDARPTHHVAVR